MNDLLKEYEQYVSRKLNINMARGKPSKEQLDLSLKMLDVVNSKTDLTIDNVDYRNYSNLDGVPECQKLFADILDMPEENITVCGASSLSIMHDLISMAMMKGVNGGVPFSKQEKIKWLCPAPGYDRHFMMSESFGFELIYIPMNEYGPNMDLVEQYIKDPTVKGIWCVPKYSNPTGIIYSDEVVRRFAKLKPASKDFRIYWDNAYVSQLSFNGEYEPVLNLFMECRKYQNEDIVYVFTSTSKVTFPGSGVAALGCSELNKKEYLDYLKYRLISYDKINQLRHAMFLKDQKGLNEHMMKHVAILKPKFDLVLKIFAEEIRGLASWSKPTGGYFISLYAPNKAKEVIEKCLEMGVTLTKAGNAYPYRNDSSNSHIRIAPTYLSLEDLKIATRVICLAVKLVNLD